MISPRPPKAPTGSPPPMIFPRAVRSGAIFSISWTPPFARRKPVITSSKIRRAPLLEQDLLRWARNPGVSGRGVVEGQHDGLPCKRLRDARAVRVAVGHRSRPGLDEHRIRMPMLAAGELDDLVAFRESTGQPDRRHGRLGAAVAHPDLPYRGHEVVYKLRHPHLVRVGRPEARAFLERRGDRLLDPGVIVAVDRGPPRAHEVDQLAAFGRDERRAARRLGEEGGASDRPERAHRGVHPPGDALQRPGEQFVGGAHWLTYFCTMGIRRPTPNASGVIFSPGAACFRLYSFRSTFRITSLTVASGNPWATRSRRDSPSSTYPLSRASSTS